MFKDHVSRNSRASELSELSPAFLVADAWVFTSWDSQAQSLLGIFMGAWLTLLHLLVAVEHDWSITVTVRDRPKTKSRTDRVTLLLNISAKQYAHPHIKQPLSRIKLS